MYQRLRELREKSGLSQTDVAKYLKITRQAYNHYETGKRTPDTKTISEIARLFSVTTDYLLGREPLDAKKDGPPSEEDEPPVDDPVIAQIMDVVRQMSPEERRLYLENLKTLRLLQEQGRKPDIQE